MPNFISEDQIEKAAVTLLHDRYSHRIINCFTEVFELIYDYASKGLKWAA